MHIPFPKMKIKRKNECKMVKKKKGKKKRNAIEHGTTNSRPTFGSHAKKRGR